MKKLRGMFLVGVLFGVVNAAHATLPPDILAQSEKWYQQPTSVICSDGAPAMSGLYKLQYEMNPKDAEIFASYYRAVELDQVAKHDDACKMLKNSGDVIVAMKNSCLDSCDRHGTIKSVHLEPDVVARCRTGCHEQLAIGVAYVKGYYASSQSFSKTECRAKIREIQEQIRVQQAQDNDSAVDKLKTIEAIVSGHGTKGATRSGTPQ